MTQTIRDRFTKARWLLALLVLPLLIAPTSGEVILGRSAPVMAAEWAAFPPYTQSIGTTPVHAFGADLTVKSTAYVQNLRVTNRSASANVCFAVVAYSSACATQCAASGITCSGAAGDGDPILPNTSYPIPIDGASCGCLVASAASTLVTTSRVVRQFQ